MRIENTGSKKILFSLAMREREGERFLALIAIESSLFDVVRAVVSNEPFCDARPITGTHRVLLDGISSIRDWNNCAERVN